MIRLNAFALRGSTGSIIHIILRQARIVYEKKYELLQMSRKKLKSSIDTHIKLKFCSQSRHICVGDFLFMRPLRPRWWKYWRGRFEGWR